MRAPSVNSNRTSTTERSLPASISSASTGASASADTSRPSLSLSASTPKYIDLPTDEAARLKWQRGRDHYGETFVGHPLLELDEELLDAMNYVTEAERQGWDLGSTGTYLWVLRSRVQSIYRAGRTPPPPLQECPPCGINHEGPCSVACNPYEY